MLYNEMTMSLRKAKQRLEADVLTLLTTFEKETGLRVEQCNFDRFSCRIGNEFGELNRVEVKINL